MRTKLLLVILIALLGGVIFWQLSSPAGAPGEPPDAGVSEAPRPEKWSSSYFAALLNEHTYPDTERLEQPPEITGHSGADSRIARLATERGYRLQSVPNVLLTEVDQVRAQPAAAAAWRELAAAAKAEAGLSLGLISGYRSVETQRTIFLNQLDLQARASLGRPYSNEEIAAGTADELINKILGEYSVPGYSRHHTGYALDVIDIGSGKPFDSFKDTEGYRWLRADNYANARRFGFVPSYPDGEQRQGANPEPWEYIWVGTEKLQ